MRALDHPTFPVNPWVFRGPEEWLAAILACSLIHGTHWVPQETLLKVYLLEVNHPQHSSRIQRIWHRLLTDWGQLVQANLRYREEWDKNRRILQNPLLVLFGTLRPGITCIVLEELILKIECWKIGWNQISQLQFRKMPRLGKLPV